MAQWMGYLDVMFCLPDKHGSLQRMTMFQWAQGACQVELFSGCPLWLIKFGPWFPAYMRCLVLRVIKFAV